MSSHQENVHAPRIQKIPDALINQIAAGEVVERPASIVKELVENSLDAHSRRIEVHLEDGGMTSLTVTDDGLGIHRDDLLLSLERHATSKLRASEELEAIGTYGFRGEALASIAAVSELEIRTRVRGEPGAFTLAVDYGVPRADIRPTGAPEGTSITVKNLFSRLPARQKFLRSAATEFSHCARVVRELAVGNPQVSFFVHHQGKLVHSFVSSSRENRVAQALRWDHPAIRVVEQTDSTTIDAFLTPADRCQDRGELLLYVNQRPVRNRALLGAIRQAYAGALGPHHDPSGVVYLDIRRDWVDVNVHPQKTEVRCYKQESLYSWILAAVRKAIATQPTVRPVTPSASEPRPQSFAREASPDRSPTPAVVPPSSSPSLQPLEQRAFDFGSATRVEGPATSYTVAASRTPTEARREWRYLGQIRAAYLLCEDSRGLLVVDQHALHEKHRFEELRRKHLEGGLRSQRLLIPRILRLSADLVPLLEEHSKTLSEMGFEIDSFGDGDWAVRSIPELIAESEAEPVVVKTLQALRDQRDAPSEIAAQAVTPILATMACHSVVRAGQTLTPVEAERLLEGIETLELGWTCPHGRPVVFRLGFNEIEKHFERK